MSYFIQVSPERIRTLGYNEHTEAIMAINEKTIRLHNDVTIPSIGYRTDFKTFGNMYQNVMTALKAGIRHIDIACDPDVEKAVGKAIADSGIPRSDLFLTFKLDNEDHGYDRAVRAVENSMKRAGTDYCDLVLIDWPNPLKYRSTYEKTAIETWKALETLYKSGKARAIGVANFESRHIEFCLEHCEISPIVNQARIYPGFPFDDNLHCAHEHAIQTEGFLPPEYKDILASREVGILAEKYHLSPWQLIMRYQLEKNTIALTQAPEEELRNLDAVFNVSISKDDMLFMDHMKNYGVENIDPDTCDF